MCGNPCPGPCRSPRGRVCRDCGPCLTQPGSGHGPPRPGGGHPPTLRPWPVLCRCPALVWSSPPPPEAGGPDHPPQHLNSTLEFMAYGGFPRNVRCGSTQHEILGQGTRGQAPRPTALRAGPKHNVRVFAPLVPAAQRAPEGHTPPCDAALCLFLFLSLFNGMIARRRSA